jgi:tripartite-type tricarboxylate transporter receptor subunit TctC
MGRVLKIVIAALALVLAAPAVAQEWPQAGKPIRILSPFPPGGTADGMARAIAAKLSPQLGVPVVVENKPGASTLVAVNELRKSPPDGETILYTITTTSQLPHFYAKPPFDIEKDFTPLGLIAFNALVLVANPKAPFNSVPELIAYARANPGKLNYASFGNGSNPHIMSELLKKTAGIQMTHIAYKGSAEAARAVIAGEVDIVFDSPVTAINNVKSGLVKALAIAGPRRLEIIGNVPTMAEAGVAGFDTPGMEQLLGPAGMPKALADKVNAALVAAIRSPEVADLYIRNGFQLVASTSEEHAMLMKENSQRWGAIIHRAGITLDQ